MDSYKTYTVTEATTKLMSYCAYRERCHKEVEKKLSEMRMIPEARQDIIHKLMKSGFLNEERFAQSFARGKFRIKKWGRLRIIRELRLRDISKYNIASALNEISEEEYHETLELLIEKRKNALTEKNTLKLKKKIVDYLLYRGWESSLVYDSLRELDNWNDTEGRF